VRRKPLVIAIGMYLGMLITSIPGCATNRVSLVDQSIVSVETVPSEKVRILLTDVYGDGENVVVYGAVQRRNYTSYPMKTHVDITVSSPDGTILHEARSLDVSVPSHRPGKTVDWKRFEVRFPDIPKGSKVRLVAHGGSH